MKEERQEGRKEPLGVEDLHLERKKLEVFFFFFLVAFEWDPAVLD